MFISRFRLRGGKCLVPKFKGGGGKYKSKRGKPHIIDRESQLLGGGGRGGGANQSQGRAKAPPGPPEINPVQYIIIDCKYRIHIHRMVMHSVFVQRITDGWVVRVQGRRGRVQSMYCLFPFEVINGHQLVLSQLLNHVAENIEWVHTIVLQLPKSFACT